MSLQLLVTYGTLMRPFDRHAGLGVEEGLVFVSSSQWSGQLFDLGPYPGAVPGPGTVHGELFRLRSRHTLDVLDRYEGYNPKSEASSLFVRRPVSLTQPEGRTAWVYWYNGEVAGHDRIPSGDWRTYKEKRDSE